MADPFSITGSAVGVVSLAIQLCKGLEWYVSGVKEAKDKAEQIMAETDELSTLLELLETIIGRVDRSQSVSKTLTGIASCADAIVTIRKKLRPDDQASDGGIKSSLKRLGKRMAFPFKEAEIEYWKGVLSTIQQSLQTALLALVIDQQRLASEENRQRFTQLSMDQAAQHHSSLQLQHVVFDKTRLQFAGHSRVVEKGFTATAHSLRSLHADVHHLQDTMQPLMALPQIQNTLERLVITTSLQTCLADTAQEAKLGEVDLTTDSTLGADMIHLRSLCRKNHRLERRLAKVTCTCQTHASAFGHRSGWLALAFTRTSIHDPECHLSSVENTVTDLQLRATLCSLILGSKVTLSLKLAYGAGFSVIHSLESHPVVTRTSPAFLFVDHLINSSFSMPEEMFRNEVKELLKMFQLGQASPRDRLPNGSTLLHHMCENGFSAKHLRCDSDMSGYTKNILYLLKTLLPRMSTLILERNDWGLMKLTGNSTGLDALMIYNPPYFWKHRLLIQIALFDYGLQITRHTLRFITYSNCHSSTFGNFSFERLTDPILDESDLLEAILSKNDHQLRHCLHRSGHSNLDIRLAFRMATLQGWMDGCKLMLDAALMPHVDDNPYEWGSFTLLGNAVSTNQSAMVQLWLSQRAELEQPQLSFIGFVEDELYSHRCYAPLIYSKDVAREMSSYLLAIRHDIRLLAEKHDIEYCCDSARSNLPDAHVRCILYALLNKGVKVPQHYWPKRKSLYHKNGCWCLKKRLVFEKQEDDGFCEISGNNFRCRMETSYSPLVYFLTQKGWEHGARRGLTRRDLAVRWFFSRGADLRETWPGSDTTASHLLGWQSAEYLLSNLATLKGETDTPMVFTWEFDAFKWLVEEEILDHCECGCSGSGCDFLTCFWKHLFTNSLPCSQFSVICDRFKDANPIGKVRSDLPTVWSGRTHEEAESDILLDLTNWVDRATRTLNLHRLICGYMRLFVFSYLDLRHTCCDIGRIQHRDNPDCDKQPYPRYSPRRLERIVDEDAALREILEELVPIFVSQYSTVGGRLQDFVSGVMIPTMREVAEELKEEDEALYTEGRKELGVVMHEHRDNGEPDDSCEEEEEEEDEDTEEESDDEY